MPYLSQNLVFIQQGPARGFFSLDVIVLFLGAIQLLLLSMIGEYLGKIFEEIKGRPQYIIQKILNNHHKNSL